MLDARLQLTIHLHSAVICPAACLMSVCGWISPLPGASSEISKSQIALPVCCELVFFAAVLLPPGASSKISESQISLPNFLRLLAEFACQYLIKPSAANYPYAAIYPCAY